MNPESIAALKLRVLRSDAELTQAEMGAKLGISGPLISMIERGKRIKSAIRIATRAAKVLRKNFDLIDYKDAKLNRLERHRPAKYLEALKNNCLDSQHRAAVEGLRQLRSDKGLTQKALGIILRVTESAVCCAEYGKCSYTTTFGMLRRAENYFARLPVLPPAPVLPPLSRLTLNESPAAPTPVTRVRTCVIIRRVRISLRDRILALN